MANIIVAGGSGALGRAVVERLSDCGHRVAIVDLAPVASTPESLFALGGIDLASESAVEKAYAEAAVALGGIDGLVNAVGGFAWDLVDGGSLENWDAMYRTNLRTTAISVRAVLRHMNAAGSAIVNVGAAAAASPAMGMAPYAASKAGVMALTESLADELKGRGIRVNAVLPTIIDTPANRRDMPDADTSAWVHPADVANVISFLLSSDAAAVTGVGIRLSLARHTD